MIARCAAEPGVAAGFVWFKWMKTIFARSAAGNVAKRINDSAMKGCGISDIARPGSSAAS